MSLNAIADLLKDTIGIDAASIGLPAVERAMNERLAACGLPDPSAYYQKVRASSTELQALIEAVVVPETWFFRDPGAFAALAHVAISALASTDVLRLLSVPASTGEEPYSMAMALLDAGVPAGRFRVDAIDISVRALARAERAVYGRNSFRGHGMTCRDGHFDSTTEGYALHEAVRGQVRFQQANLLSPAFMAGADAYDVIFCRNMLIYFDRATQDRAMTTLDGLLKSTGVLFVGSSESGVFLNRAFASAQMPLAFAFRKASATERPEPRTARRAPRRPAVDRAVRTARVAPVTPGPLDVPRHAELAPRVPLEQQPLERDMDDAMRLANQGRFVEAAECCESVLRRQGPSADAFHLLGLVRDTCGETSEAVAYYRKALYLDPCHPEAVVHLALLMERQGRAAEAQVLWTRARRLATHVAGAQ